MLLKYASAFAIVALMGLLGKVSHDTYATGDAQTGGPMNGMTPDLLAQQRQHTLRDLVGLGHHGGAGLLQDLGAR